MAQSEHSVIASTFADLADVVAFRKCRAQGKSEQECFKVGDNGVGCWGDNTAQSSVPMCALPPEDMEEHWGSTLKARRKLVSVTYKDRNAVCILADRMPRRANIKNGAGIDLNPAAVIKLGIPKGGMVRVIWKWV